MLASVSNENPLYGLLASTTDSAMKQAMQAPGLCHKTSKAGPAVACKFTLCSHMLWIIPLLSTDAVQCMMCRYDAHQFENLEPADYAQASGRCILNCDHLLAIMDVPNAHWYLVCIDMQSRHIQLYDTLLGDDGRPMFQVTNLNYPSATCMLHDCGNLMALEAEHCLGKATREVVHRP